MKSTREFESQEQGDPLKESAIACIFKLSSIISDCVKEVRSKRFSDEDFKMIDLRFLDLLLKIKYEDVASQQTVTFEESVRLLVDGYLHEITQKKAKLRFINLVRTGLQKSYKNFFRRIEHEKKIAGKKGLRGMSEIIAKFESDQQGKAILLGGVMEVLSASEQDIEGRKKR